MNKQYPVIIYTPFFIALTVLVSALFSFGGCDSSDSNTSKNIPYATQDNALQTLFEQYLTSPSLSWNEPAEILVGKIPSSIPIDLPVPNDTEIIGSVMRFADQYDVTEIILNTPGEPENIVAFYRDYLIDNGWTELKSHSSSSSGFRPPLSYGQAEFCLDDAVNIAVRAVTKANEQDHLLDLRLIFYTNMESSKCSVSGANRIVESEAILPTLTWPEGAIIKDSSGGGGSDDRHIGMALKTDLSLEDFETHYKNQLTEAGWRLEDQGDSDTLIWDRFAITDESGGKWSAIMILHELDDNVKRIHIQVDLIK